MVRKLTDEIALFLDRKEVFLAQMRKLAGAGSEEPHYANCMVWRREGVVSWIQGHVGPNHGEPSCSDIWPPEKLDESVVQWTLG